MEYIVIILFLLIFSAFFSSAETAYFNLKKHRESIPERVKDLLDRPKSLLISLLTGNTIINISIGSLAAFLTTKYAKEFDLPETTLLLLEVVLISSIILIVGEILPKLFAMRYSVRYASIINKPLRLIIWIFRPITLLLNALTDSISKLLPINEEKIFDSEEELKILTELGEEEGTLQEDESEIIQSIFEFNDKKVREIMTPRVDMIALDSSSDLDQIMDLIAKRQFSKIPIYKDNIDNIKGIIYAKDLIPYLIGSRPNFPILSIARNPIFVPESKPIDDLMDNFKMKKTNIAIVVDEWGGTSGLITLEDIVEEVFGEIRDPYDKEETLVAHQKDNSLIVDGKISIYDLQEEIEIDFPEDREYDTLGGFVLQAYGDIPSKNDEVEHENYKFVVKKVDSHRIDKIQVVKIA